MTNGPTADQKPQMSLYDRMGGELAVDMLTMAFYANLNADKRLSHFFDGIDLMKQIGHQKRFLTFALGGTNEYDGDKLGVAHKRLNLTTEDFDGFNEVLRATLYELDVNAKISEEVLAITERASVKILEYCKRTA